MALTKAQLISELASMYLTIGTPENPGSEGPVNGVTKYLVNVVEVGKSQQSQKPTAYRKNMVFYVYHEGLGDESAYYERLEPTNDVNKDVAAPAPGLLNYYAIFNSDVLRQKVLGAIIKAANAIINEDPGTADHSIRFKWANSVLLNPNAYNDAFMIESACNVNVQIAGANALDGDLEWIVNSQIKTIAIAAGFTA